MDYYWFNNIKVSRPDKTSVTGLGRYKYCDIFFLKKNMNNDLEKGAVAIY